MNMACEKCHKCGAQIRIVLDGEEWCDSCQSYQRPIAHGWSTIYKDNSQCNNVRGETNGN